MFRWRWINAKAINTTGKYMNWSCVQLGFVYNLVECFALVCFDLRFSLSLSIDCNAFENVMWWSIFDNLSLNPNAFCLGKSTSHAITFGYTQACTVRYRPKRKWLFFYAIWSGSLNWNRKQNWSHFTIYNSSNEFLPHKCKYTTRKTSTGLSESNFDNVNVGGWVCAASIRNYIESQLQTMTFVIV